MYRYLHGLGVPRPGRLEGCHKELFCHASDMRFQSLTVDEGIKDAMYDICLCRYSLPSQQHFYMETQCAVAEPAEGGGMIVHSSTQTLDGVQSAAARALGIPCHKVTACEQAPSCTCLKLPRKRNFCLHGNKTCSSKLWAQQPALLWQSIETGVAAVHLPIQGSA
jgi:hypothetical protein